MKACGFLCRGGVRAVPPNNNTMAVWSQHRAQKQVAELEGDVEALEEEVERLSGPAAEAAEAKATLQGAQAEAHAVRGQVRAQAAASLQCKNPNPEP